MKMLHESHVGMVRMKAEARRLCRWPNIDRDLENTATKCSICTLMAKTPAKVPLQHWKIPPGPWYRIHIDLAGPIKNAMLLVLVDAYSKWPEVFIL